MSQKILGAHTHLKALQTLNIGTHREHSFDLSLSSVGRESTPPLPKRRFLRYFCKAKLHQQTCTNLDELAVEFHRNNLMQPLGLH